MSTSSAPLTQAERDVDAAALALEADPSPAHEVALRGALEVAGVTGEEADRFVRELRASR